MVLFILFDPSVVVHMFSQKLAPGSLSKNLSFVKFTWKYLCQSFFFSKVASWRPVTSIKKRLQHRCFPANFSKRTPILKNISERLPLQFVDLWDYFALQSMLLTVYWDTIILISYSEHSAKPSLNGTWKLFQCITYF